MTGAVSIPISKQAVDMTAHGEPDLSWYHQDINPAVQWRWMNDPEYRALITAWHLESGVPIEDLLEQHSDNLPYVRSGLPAQYRGMRSSKPFSLALMDELVRNTYGPAITEHIAMHNTMLRALYPDGPPKRSWWKRHKPKLPHLRVVWR